MLLVIIVNMPSNKKTVPGKDGLLRAGRSEGSRSRVAGIFRRWYYNPDRRKKEVFGK